MWYILGPILSVAVLLTAWLILFYNKMVSAKTKVENSWGQIDVQLKMRTDLIPNLVETVGAYADHERETLTGVTEARARLMKAGSPVEIMKSSDELTGLLGRIMAISEQYPDLKASQNFIQLQNQLDELEKKIALYRQFYNDTVLMYNKLVITFPNNIAAMLMGASKLPYFEIDESERNVPRVKFK